MKKAIIFISILAAGAIIIVFSCSKETGFNKESEKVNNPQLSDYEVKVNKTIKDFKEKMVYYRENPHLKSGESVPADTALWYLEATINYSHSFPNEFYIEMQSDELTLMVPKNGSGEVDMVVLTQKYDEMKAEITNIYYNSGFEEKGLVLVDLSETSQTADEITFTAETVTGNKGPDPGPGPFVEGDNWWYGEFRGHCFPHTWDTDASQELEQAMNDYIAEHNAGLFFIHQTDRYRKGGDPNIRREGDPDPPNNVYDYYLYSSSTEYGTVTDEILCLDYMEMNVYYDYLKYLLYTKIPDEDLPPGYRIEIIVGMSGYFEPDGPYTHYLHEGNFKYGYPIGYDEGEGPDEL
ncbi:MAG: hypothetical protein H8D45_22725 [Bacteroidetes bacterium]|nr:hypothetical protein [Bacteroidota bacterium]